MPPVLVAESFSGASGSLDGIHEFQDFPLPLAEGSRCIAEAFVRFCSRPPEPRLFFRQAPIGDAVFEANLAGFIGVPILRAMDKQTGETVHEVELPGIPQGAPMSYMIDGKQYIAVATGGGSEARLVTLSLP